MLDAIDFGIVLWLVVAAMSGLGEIVSGTLFLLPFTIGAFVAAGLVALGVDMVWALVVFAVISVSSLVWLRRFAVGGAAESAPNRAGGGRYIDAIGLVTEDIVGASAGRVRIETESWRARSSDGESISAGVKVRVVLVRGNALIVEPV
jgi:membrane protein implicated in regulation of membrane protease activity